MDRQRIARLLVDARGVDGLIGPRMAVTRREIMREITGERLPISKCGFNTTRSHLFKAFGVSSEDCIAGKMKALNACMKKYA